MCICRFRLFWKKPKSAIRPLAHFGEVSGGPLKIGLDSSNFVSEFLGWFRFCRHLNQVSSSILAHMVDKTWFFLYGVSKIQVSSITSERIDPNSWLRCLQKRNHPRNTLTKFEESRIILRGPPKTSPWLASMKLQVMAKLAYTASQKTKFLR